MSKKFARMISLLLVLVTVLSCIPALSLIASAESGYDRGYKGGAAGTGKVLAHGLDVSKWQGDNINFKDIKNAGYSFVILRCGSGNGNGKDIRFEQYYKAARAAGLNIGAYFYSYASNTTIARNEANNCLSYIKGKKFEYPIYYDFEDKKSNSGNSNTAFNICRAFMDTVSNEGYLVGMYASAGWMDPNKSGSWVPYDRICGQKYECWVAHYTSSRKLDATLRDRYMKRYGMYQYSDQNYVNGFGPLDANVCSKDYPTIVKTYGFNGYAPTQQGGSEEVSYYRACSPLCATLIEGLDSLGVDSSKDFRSKIAAVNNITNYTGTAAQNTKMFELLKAGKLIQASGGKKVGGSYYPKCPAACKTLAQGLEAVYADSSLEKRVVIAKNNGVPNYTATAEQDAKLLDLMKQGKLSKLEKVDLPVDPDDLKKDNPEPTTPTEPEKPAESTVQYYPKCASSYTSLVEALKSIGVDSSKANRTKIAAANGISNYTGTASQNNTLLDKLKAGKLVKPSGAAATTPTVTYFPKCASKYTSLVEALKSIGVDSSKAYRTKIAAKNGISNYTGTASQNNTLLDKLKAGKLIKP